MNGKVTYRQQYTRCGKERCRKCKEGEGHGPYWYAYWSENGRTVSKYIGIHAPTEIAVQEAFSAQVQESVKAERSHDQSSLRAPALPHDINALAEEQPAFDPLQGMDAPTKEQTAPAPSQSTDEPTETQEHLSKRQYFSENSGTQPSLRMYLLGQFSVERKEGDAWHTIANRTWQRRRARALLGCLLSQAGRRMGREQTMEALWPDLDIETASNRLNGAVHELRQILEPHLARPAASTMLRLERDILTLADSSSIWVDAEAFETVLNRANTTTDPDLLEQLLEQAAILYDGDYLLEELYSQWATSRRESLRRGWMGLLLELARLRAARSAFTSAIEPLDRLLKADPTHETAVRRLMVLLTQMDRRGEAIRAYQRLADILKNEYESEPLAETVQLYKELRQGQAQTAGNGAISGHVHSDAESSGSHVQAGSHGPPRQTEVQDATTSLLVSSQIGRHNQSPLIGRENELETMRQVLLAIDRISPQAAADARKKTGAPTRESKLVHFAMVMGETGIGKTRLAEELSHEAQARGWLVAWTRAYEQEGTIPYRPWTDILRTLLRDMPLTHITTMLEEKRSPGEPAGALNHAATVQAKLARLNALLPELTTTHETPSSTQNRPVSPEQERLYLWEAVLSLLNALSQSAPLLLVLDDLHWTDDSSLELLAYLARHQPNERIMWIGTCQDTELAPSGSLRVLLNDLRREQILVTLPLRPLTSTQIGRLIAHLPRTLVQSIQSQSGGNPLFAEELARFGENAGENNKRHGYHLEIIAGLKSASLPETIAAVLERRLNTLSGECQVLLSKAAVLGGSFELCLLLRMTGEAGPGEDTALDLLEAALRSGLLTEVANGTKIIYHFWHPLIVSHLYERLSAARRAQLHRRAAEALIELYVGNEIEVAAAIAHHLSKYGQEKQQLVYYAESAGNQARELSAYPEALYHYRQALEALRSLHNTKLAQEQDSLHLANLLECLAECNMVQGNYQEARQQYIQALDLHSAQKIDISAFAGSEEWLVWQQEEAQVQALLWREIGSTWRHVGEYRQAHECVEKGRHVLRMAEITTGAAWACLQRLDGITYWSEGNFDQAKRYIQECMEIHQEIMLQPITPEQRQRNLIYKASVPASLITYSRRALLGDPLELGRTHESLGVIAASEGRTVESLAHLHTALAVFEEHDLVRGMSQVCSNIGAVNSMRSEYETASTYFKRSLELAERIGDVSTKALVTGNLGDVAARTGKLHDAQIWLMDSLTLAEQVHDREHSSWCLVTLAGVQQALGNTRGALENIRHALVAGHAIKSSVRLGFALVMLADWRVTRALYYHNLETGHLDTHTSLSPVSQTLLRSAQATVECALALDSIDAETQSMAQVVLAHIYYLRGDLEEAQQQILKALEVTQQREIAYLYGRAQRLLGEIQAARGSEQEADRSFEKALQTCQQYDLRLDYARVLHRYGACLLQRGSQTGTGHHSIYQQGLGYLGEARDIFTTCQASLDLQWVERILATCAPPYARS
ncbi:MAG: DUF6788 family protein [Ktedonobacteraceae bacterium]